MLKLNSFLKEKNVDFSLKRNKPKFEPIQNNSIPTEDVFILLLFKRLGLAQN